MLVAPVAFANLVAMCSMVISPVDYFTVDVRGLLFMPSQSHAVEAVQSQFPPECGQFLEPQNLSCGLIGPSSFSQVCYFETKRFGAFYTKLDFMDTLHVLHINWD